MDHKKHIIIFDLDGVIINSSDVAYERTLEMFPHITREESLEMLAENFHDAMQKYRMNFPPKEQTEEEKQEQKTRYAARKLECEVFGGMKELLEQLFMRGYILAINTSAYDRYCIPLLDKANLTQYFDFMGTAEMSKSKSEKFEMIIEKYNIPKEHALFVTDTLGDILEAKFSGIPTIAVSWGAHNHAFFTREAHENLVAIIDTPQELGNLIIHNG